MEHGFKQAETVILKLENIDTGLFNEAIDYLVRNEIPCGNILMINKYGKTRITSKTLCEEYREKDYLCEKDS